MLGEFFINIIFGAPNGNGIADIGMLFAVMFIVLLIIGALTYWLT